MRFLLPVFLVICSGIAVLAQNSSAKEPFIIQGQLANFKEKELMFFFRDPKKGLKDHSIENIEVDSTGKFYLKTYSISSPTMATLRKGSVSVNIYAAPGYNLTLTGDTKDLQRFMLEKKITGVGAESNQYLLAHDIVMFTAYRNEVPWYELGEKELLKFVKKDELRRDSLYLQVFGNKKVKDKWFKDFARLTLLDNRFLDSYYLLNLVTYDSTFTYDRSVALLAAHTDKKLWDNLYSEENLISENYITWFMGTYSEYLRKQAVRKDSAYAQKNEEVSLVKEIAKHYKGQIREIKLFTKMKGIIRYCRSFEELEGYQNTMPKYITLLKSTADQAELTKLLEDKGIELMSAQIGKPAPLFEVPDSSGVLHKLDDYKGKVVYLDLWASWCGPCRAETPHFKTLAEKYKGNSNIAFISVAVLDKPDKWREALIKDNPSGLQLYDTEGIVQKGYFASSIPKFILINKKGEIVSFDAPAPSSGAALETMLDKEIKN